MYPGMASPEELTAAREIGKHLVMEIIKYPAEGRMEVKVTKTNPGEEYTPGLVIDSLALTLSNGMAAYLGMEVKVITQ